MAHFRLFLVILISTVYFSDSAKLVDPIKCKDGCQADDQCPVNSECKIFPWKEGNTNCGFCVCAEGYKIQGNKCAVDKSYTSTTSTTSTSTSSSTSTSTTTFATESTTTESTTTSTTTQSTTTGTTSQPAVPPVPDPVYCPDFDCTVSPKVDVNDQDPLQVRSALVAGNPPPGCKRELFIQHRPCNVQGGGYCYGSYCLTVSPGNDYCICPYYRVDRQCAVDKPGSCNAATGTISPGMIQLQNRRLRKPQDRDHGAVYGRHFTPNLNDCVKLCQWSQGQCRSVNYGPINGANVCELLSIAATEKSALAIWLEQAPGWQYAQVMPAFA